MGSAQQQSDHSAVASSSSLQPGGSLKAEDEKLSNGRVLVVHTLDGKDAVKGGKGRRRGRFIILVDEGEERTRWIPWILLSVLIIAVGIGTYFIIARLKKADTEVAKSSNNKRRALDGEVEQFDSCGGGDRSLITRLRDTAKQTSIQDFGIVQSQWNKADTVWVDTASIALSETSTSGYSHDIIVPPTQDASTYSEVAEGPRGYAYAVSGSELLVLSSKQNTSGVINRLDFATLPPFQAQKRLTLRNEEAQKGPFPVDTGLATFTANQILLPKDKNVLLVIGSAVAAAPVIPGPTPNIVVGAPTKRSTTYTHPTFRPFDTTVVIIVDISQPEKPVTHSMSEHEGRFAAAIEEKEDWAWVFIRASAHVSATHAAEDDSQLDDSIMPLFRYIPHKNESELEAWQAVGSCSDVSHLELFLSERANPSYILVAQAVNINIFDGGGFQEEADSKPHLFVMGWSNTMQPVLPGKSEAEDSTLQLFLTEAIAGSQPTASATSAPSTTATAGTAPVESSSTATALTVFSLAQGKMNINATSTPSTVSLEGDTRFMGAMHFLPESRQLSLLLTETLDGSSDDSTRSALYLYNTTQQLSQEYNKTEQFRDRVPTSIVYMAADSVVTAAFVGFAFGALPLVQVLPLAPSGSLDCTATRADCGPSVQRLFVKEQVSLMKGFSVDMPGSPPANFLLVAGRQVAESDNGVTTSASPPEPDVDPAAVSTAPTGELQFSLYSYLVGDNRMVHLNTESVAPGRVLSEAFQDARAAWLFHAPSKDNPSSLFLALPVSIIEDATELLAQLGCTGTKGFSGTLIWRIDPKIAADERTASASVVRVAAVPSTGTCGRGNTATYEETMVKRMRFFGEGADQQFMTISNCHTVSMLWSDVVAAIPESLPQSLDGNTTANATQPASGVFTKMVVTSQAFSGDPTLCVPQ